MARAVSRKTEKGVEGGSAKAIGKGKAPPVQPSVEILETVPVVPVNDVKVVWDRVESLEYSTTSSQGPITPEDARKMLEWETESEYRARMTLEQPDKESAQWVYADEYHCKNVAGEKVRCWRNAGNRPFDMDWCEKLKDTILKGLWAGPLTVPGETVNGEAIRISKYGRVLSGQHQLTALMLAWEDLNNSRDKKHKDGMYYDAEDPESEKYPFWRGHDHPVIETFVTTGLSEDQRVLQSIDYVKPRSVADMLFTMPLFREKTSWERKEMTRMLASGLDLLWERTDAKGYKTHPEMAGFLERHRKLLQATEHLFVINQPVSGGNKRKLEGESDEEHKKRLIAQALEGGRRITKLKLSSGHCAALLYLMGSSGTDENASYKYRNEKPPTEKGLDWSMWDRAKEFWSLLSEDDKFIAVRVALNRLLESEWDSEDNQGMGGRVDERFAILSKAWAVFRDHPDSAGDPFPSDKDELGRSYYPDLVGPEGALFLAYSGLDSKGHPLPEGKLELIDRADFMGIDWPDEGDSKVDKNGPPAPPPPTPEELAQRMRETRPALDKPPIRRSMGKLDELAERAVANSAADKAKRENGNLSVKVDVPTLGVDSTAKSKRRPIVRK